MRYQLLGVLLLCSLVSATLVGCSAAPPPTTATQTLIVTAPPITPAPDAAVVSLTAEPTFTDRITLAPFTIILPTSWPVLRPTEIAWAAQLAQIETQNPPLAYYLMALTTTAAVRKTIALAWLPTPEGELTLTATVVPADGVSLPGYLAAAQTELAQSRLALGSGITVQRAVIRYDLHEEHIPVATILYTMPGSKTGVTERRPVTGYQAAMLDTTGTHLLLLTFVTPQTQPDATVALIESIVAQLQNAAVD
jgi:hypothetical protein